MYSSPIVGHHVFPLNMPAWSLSGSFTTSQARNWPLSEPDPIVPFVCTSRIDASSAAVQLAFFENQSGCAIAPHTMQQERDLPSPRLRMAAAVAEQFSTLKTPRWGSVQSILHSFSGSVKSYCA